MSFQPVLLCTVPVLGSGKDSWLAARDGVGGGGGEWFQFKLVLLK